MLFTLLVVGLCFILPFIWPIVVAVLVYLGGVSLIFETIQLVFTLLLDDIYSFKDLILPARKNLAGKLVLMTGGGRGIGRLMALDFARKGSIVVIWDKQGADEVVKEITALGRRAYAYTVDLSDRKSIYETAEMVKKDVGDIDILVNNAGIVTGKPFMDSTDEMIELTMKVNTLAHFWTLKAFLPAMLKRKSGHVVTIASSAGLTGVPGLVDYCASKYAAVGIDESLRHELYKLRLTGINTLVVCPFFINTGMFDGVTTRFPLLLPILEADYAAKQIMNAIETNKVQLCMPVMIWSIGWIRALFCAPIVAKLSQFLGVWDSMNEFKGRQGK